MQKYDLIVVGGGLSGVAAATAAARDGMSVLLIEKSGCLGGAMSNSLVYPFTRFWTTENGKRKYLNGGLFDEMRTRQERYEVNPENSADYFMPEYFKLALDDMLESCGVTTLFHAFVFEVITKNGKITGVRTAVKTGVMGFEADFFIDATGDGDLFTLAGCDFRLGRDGDGLCQPMTTCFRMSGVDTELFKNDGSRLQELYKKMQAEGKIKNPREDLLCFFGIGKGIVHFNTTRIVRHDPTNPFEVSHAEIEARRQVHEIVAFLKNNSRAFSESTVISIASEIGVRESRMLNGEHILTVDEIKNCKYFDDAIALGNYDIDIHNPEGSGTSHYYFKDGEFYTIPYRCLLPREYDNLLVAGRCISVTHEAQASIRIMAICSCLGEAAGSAAALAKRENTGVHGIDVSELRKKLISNGVVLN